MSEEDDRRRLIEESCLRWEADLRAFLRGVLRDGHLVDDCFQRLVVQALRKYETVDPERIRGWLFQIALNEARLIRRVERRTRDVVSSLGEIVEEAEVSYSTSPLDASLVAQELKDAVKRSLALLPEDLRTVVMMRLYEGRSFASISDSLALPIGTVLTRMRRAIQKLRDDPVLKAWFQE